MKSTKSKQVISPRTGEIFASGKVWTREQLDEFRKYQAKFNRNKYRTFVFRMGRIADADIVCYLQDKDNLADYLRCLIREDMERRQYNYDPEKDPECLVFDDKNNIIGLNEEKIDLIKKTLNIK